MSKFFLALGCLGLLAAPAMADRNCSQGSAQGSPYGQSGWNGNGYTYSNNGAYSNGNTGRRHHRRNNSNYNQGYNTTGYAPGYSNGYANQGYSTGYAPGYNNGYANQGYYNQGYQPGYNQGYYNQGYQPGYNNQGYNNNGLIPNILSGMFRR